MTFLSKHLQLSLLLKPPFQCLRIKSDLQALHVTPVPATLFGILPVQSHRSPHLPCTDGTELFAILEYDMLFHSPTSPYAWNALPIQVSVKNIYQLLRCGLCIDSFLNKSFSNALLG